MESAEARRPKFHPDQQPVRVETNIGALPVPAFVVDLDGVVTAWNRAAHQLYGLAADAAVGRRLADLRIVEPLASLVGKVDNVCRARAPAEVSNVHVGPGHAMVRITISPLIDDAARLTGCLVVGEQPASEFIAVLAHELRNPLSPILSATSIIRRLAGRQPGIGPALRVVQRQVGHLARLVDDLLDLARLRQGHIELRRTAVVLGEAVDEAIQSAQERIEARGVRVSTEFPPEPIVVDADPTRLVQIIANLVNNAVKFTGAAGAITVTGAAAGAVARLNVFDTGIGIAPTALPHVFDLFAQTKPAADRSRGGLGIGLALVKSLVELHGGSITAHSDGLGHGASFLVMLPLASAPPVSASVSAAPAGARWQLLIVEDDRDTREMLRHALDMEGHAVVAARDAQTALETLDATVPDVVVVDLGLPGVDGFEVAQRIRGALGDRPLMIALTGYGDAESRRRAVEVGFDLHVLKPVDPLDLLEVIAAHVGRR